MPTYILGISAFYHDSAACLLRDGAVVAAAQEERFTRKKHDAAFPKQAILYCLREAGVALTDVRSVVYYEKPFLKFERLLETYMSFAPAGIRSFAASMPSWLKEKLFQKSSIVRDLAALAAVDEDKVPELLFTEHHQSHAASAFYPSPYERAAVLCMDGVGEWATTSAWLGEGKTLSPLWDIPFPHSIGLLYSAFTYFTGFKVNSGEYKVMGLAPYGEPKYTQAILEHLIDVKADGTFRMNMEYFDYCTGLRMTNARFDALFGGPPRASESKLTQREMDLARSVQEVTELVMLRLARTLYEETGAKNLCMAGGVALNCVGNGRVLREGPFEGIWIQPAAGDAGGAVGCAMAAHYLRPDSARTSDGKTDAMRGGYLGPAFTNDEVERVLKDKSAPYERVDGDALYARVAELLAGGAVVGWCQGRMEFGPRALGGRSILGDPRSPKMQSVMNLKIKYRESFRPFAPSVLRARAADYFEIEVDSPYMLLVAQVKKERMIEPTAEQAKLWGIDRLNVPRSDLPAVTHVDGSARIQTVHEATNPGYHRLLSAFEEKTGCAVLVNTSFNVRGEPIVCSPEDAYRCFMRTEMDWLVVENCLIEKVRQPKVEDDGAWRQEFALD